MTDLEKQIEQAAACERWRLSAWLPYDVVCGRVVDHFSLTHWAALVDSENAFTTGDMPTGGDIAQVLWMIQPNFDWLSKPDKKWLREIGKMDTTETVKEIAEYIQRALYDASEGTGESFAIPIAPFPAHFANRFCELYGWTMDEVMRAPIARLMQMDRVARSAAGDTSVYGSKLIALRVMKRQQEAAR